MNKKHFKKRLNDESVSFVHPCPKCPHCAPLVPPVGSRGVATLPTVMVIGIMALAVAVGVTAVALTESFISQGSNQSTKALFFAEAGARDALIRVARDKTFTTASYTIDFTTNGTGCSGLWGGCATVAVGSGSPKVATSTGASGVSTRTLVVSITQSTDGEITGTTWTEATN